MPLWPTDWTKVLVPDAPVMELVVRISIVYLFVFVLLRVVLKRESGGTSISDLLVIVLIADVAQNGMAGQYTSVGGALVLVTTLVFWDWALSYLAYHVPWFAHLVRPEPLLIIQDGRILQANARHELLTRQEIDEQLRLQGIESISEVAKAYMESNGEIAIIRVDGSESGSKKQKRRGT